MMGVPGGPPPPDGPYGEATTNIRKNYFLALRFLWNKNVVGIKFSPRRRRERVMSKASESKETRV